jgi:hypothetical protein
MKQFDARAYSIADFVEWHGSGLLDLSPKFQRRGVWNRAAKSFLIDTVLRGKPMPKVLLTQDLVGGRNVRTVVDGQQRIRTVLEFIGGGFTVLRAHNEDYHGRLYDQLDEDAKATILQYEIGVDLLFNVSLADMLDIFARINTYSVTLNTQEKLNAKYLGSFKTTAYELGHAYAGYWIDAGVLTDKQVSRMAEAQLASDLLVAFVGGVQTIKNIERFYRLYEAAEGVPEELTTARQRFERAMAYAGAIYPADDLKNTDWKRPHWFYTLVTCIGHSIHPLAGLEDAPRPPATEQNLATWRAALDEISARYEEYTQGGAGNPPQDYADYINYAQRRTTDTDARRERAKFVLARIVA